MKRLQNITLISALVLGVALSAAARADSAPAKLAIINMQRSIQSVAAGKKARETLQKEWEEKQKKMQAEGKKIQDSMDELRKQSMVLDEKSRQEKEEAIQKRILDMREQEARQTAEFQKRDQEVSEPIIKKIRELVGALSKEKGYTLVIDGNEGNVIFNGGTDDITDEIIKRYDAKK